jgi:hypothetical protein
MNGTATIERLRLLGASGGAVFAVLTLVAFMMHPGPSTSDGVTVVEYYTAHGTATLWGAALVGVAMVCFIWFAETFARSMSATPVGLVGAAVTAALYLVAVGCWEILAEIFSSVDIVDVPSQGYNTAHVIQVVGVGAAHMGNFGAAAFVGATAAAMLTAEAPWRRLGWLGVVVAVFRLVSALIELASSSDWSDAVSTAGFLAFLAWVFAASMMLVATRRRGVALVPQTAA